MKFEIRRSKRNQQYRAYIIADNGLKLFTSEQYKTSAKAVHVLRIVDDSLPIDIFDMRGDWTRTIEAQREDVYAQ